MINSKVTKAREEKNNNNTIHKDNKGATINRTGDRKIEATEWGIKKETEDKNFRGTPKEIKWKLKRRLK